MGFLETKKMFLAALKDGRIEHETRASQNEKNWVSSGLITLVEACEIVSATKGTNAETDRHHFDSSIEIWIFKPTYRGARWYVKGYILGDEIHLVELRLVSFHPSGAKE